MLTPYDDPYMNIQAKQPGLPQQQHHKLYFPDGDIVLSAEKSNHTANVLMRVHTVILGHYSAVFSGLFSLPVSSNANEMYDGLPVVQMTDTAEDLAKFIETLYDPRYVDITHVSSALTNRQLELDITREL